MNPCPCGYQGDSQDRCRCTEGQVRRYRNRLSGPLIDRIDAHVELTALPPDELLDDAADNTETSAVVAGRVAAARKLQLQRQGKLNARLSPKEIFRLCRLDAESRRLLGTAMARLGLSARACHRVLKLARTCADLAGEPSIRAAHVSEAVRLRVLDRCPAPGREARSR